MTTIIYKDGVICADSQATVYGQIVVGVCKVFRTKHWLCGVCGDALEILPFRSVLPELLPTGEYKYDPEKFGRLLSGFRDSDSIALLANRRGDVFEMSLANGFAVCIDNPYRAIGSGSRFASVALESGACGMEAIHVAARFDPYTNNEIDLIAFDRKHQK